MKKQAGFIIMILAVLSLTAGLASGARSKFISIESSDSSGLILSIRVQKPDIEEVSEAGDLYHRIRIPGFISTDEPGSPELLKTAALLGIPEDGSPSIEILDTKINILPGYYHVYPAPMPVITGEGRDSRLEYEFTMNNEIYLGSEFMPTDIAEIEFTGFMREQKVVRLMIYPLQFNPVTGELRYYSNITVKLNFNTVPVTDSSSAARGKTGKHGTAKEKNAYKRMLKSVLLNSE